MRMPAACPEAVRIPTQALSTPTRELLRAVAQTLADAVLVGGAVRDLLRGADPLDIDLTVAGDASLAAGALARRLGGRAFAMDIERGQHRVVLPGDARVRDIDVSSRGPDLEGDLLRRDFTVNALAAPLRPDGEPAEVIDLCGGLADLEAHCLRMVGERALVEDPLRLLRGVRLALELGFEIEPETAAAARRLAPTLALAAAERSRDELARIAATSHAADGVRLLDSLGLLPVLLPELLPAKGVGQPERHHHYDVFEHSLETLAALDAFLPHPPSPLAGGRGPGPAPTTDWRATAVSELLAWYPLTQYLAEKVGGHSRLVLLKLAGLLHDVAKPETKSVDADGRVRFLGHSELGAVKAAGVLRRLRFGSREERFVALLVDEHLRPAQLSSGDLPSRRALYRFFRDLGGAAPACLLLSLADAAAAAGPRLRPSRWSGQVAYLSWVLQQAEGLVSDRPRERRLLDGDELMAALGIGPGPQVGRLLRAIEEAVAAGEVSSTAEALEYARSITSPPARSPSAERGDEALPAAGELIETAASQAAGGLATSPPAPSPSAESGSRDPGADLGDRMRIWRTTPGPWARLKPLTREMRHEPTQAEEALWRQLRRRQLDGLHFRRQHSLDRFIVDFYCASAGLVIEVDGSVHEGSQEGDATRQGFLESLGLRVLRFTNQQVLNDPDAVLRQIREAVAVPQPEAAPPLRARRRGRGER